MMDIKVQHEDPSIQTSPLLTVPITVIPESSTASATTIPSPIPSFTPLPQQSTPIPTPTTTEAIISTTYAPDSSTLTAFYQRLFDLEKEVKKLKNVNHSLVLHATIKSEVLAVKRKPDDADRDEDHPAGPDQGLKRRKTSKDTKQSKKASQLEPPKAVPNYSQNLLASLYKQRRQCLRLEILKPPTPDPEWNEGKTVDNKQTRKWLSDLEKAETSSKTFDDLMSTPIDFSAFVMNCLQISNLTQDILVGPTYKLLKGTCRSYVRLEYNMEECYKALTDQLDWNNPEGDRYPFNLSKPLPLVKLGNRQIIQVDYFFNNDLAYLQGESTDITYTNSSTKTKATKYDLPGIEDMIPNLWSPIKVAYDKHALLGTSHLGPKRQILRICF
ncbi:hypothetical protein Tco_1236310 [Tanacetum coccineum]